MNETTYTAEIVPHFPTKASLGPVSVLAKSEREAVETVARILAVNWPAVCHGRIEDGAVVLASKSGHNLPGGEPAYKEGWLVTVAYEPGRYRDDSYYLGFLVKIK